MGARGPKPRPTALRIIDGNPSRRPLEKGEAKATGTALCPRHLSPVAKRRWKRIMLAMPPGFYSPADEALLAAYCEAWRAHVEATKALADGRSLVVKTANGFAVSPLVHIQARAASTMATLGTRLGLSPADRAGMTVPTQQGAKKSKWHGLIAP